MSGAGEDGQWVDRRGACPCCGGAGAEAGWGVVSPFLARRAFGEAPSPTPIERCAACGHAWSGRGLSPSQAGRLYGGYRGEEYFRQRNGFEPWYTRKANGEMGSEAEMEKRRGVLAQALAMAQAKLPPRPQGVAFDFGGDRGQMLRGLPDERKLVHDMSGAEPDPWAERAPELAPWEGKCDLVLNCQVLEHVDDPAEVLGQAARLAKPGGWVYVEVPDESWRSFPAMPKPARLAWLRFACRSPRLLMALDFASTGCRRALGWIPPLGFWSMREHVNFFTPQSLRLLAEAAGLEVATLAKTGSGLSAVARKPQG